jgi:hypothetical protein
MDLSFYPLTLEAIDQAAVETLCLFIAADERPLTGLAGLADWRLSGRLSRLLRAGLLSGDAGEAVLTPPGARLGFQKLFVFGVGRSDESEEALVAHLGLALRKLTEAGVRDAAMQLPARLAPEVGIRALVAGLPGPGRAILFAPDPQKLVAALSQVASGQAQTERRAVKAPAGPPPAKHALPRNPPPPPSLPKVSPPPFAPQRDSPLAQLAPVPTASALPIPPEPIAPAVESKPEAERRAEPKPTPPPPQRYVPPAPKPNVFQKGKKKHR